MTARAATLVARTTSATETQQLAAALAALVQPGDLVVLAGDLGAGKTTFTQGFGRALGVTEPITSPTFTLAQQYEGRLRVHHLDVYRLEQLAEVAELGLSELLDDGGVVLIEWGDAILGVLPGDYLEVRLTYGDRDASGAVDGAAEAAPIAEAASIAEAAPIAEDAHVGEAGDDDRRVVVRGVGRCWAGRQVSLLHAVAPWAEAPDGVPGDPPC
jgi:tRNA threonylcarbamoyladenosine biosynthesis protein TsaE